MKIQEQIIKHAKELLETGQVKVVVGYKANSQGGQSPTFAHQVKEADVLTFSPLSFFNLPKYLPWIKSSAAVVVKGCDSRALNQLIAENKVKRNKIKVIGINCPGVIDERKLALQEISIFDILEVNVDEKVKIKTNKGNLELAKIEALADKCLGCKYPNPADADIVIGQEQKPADLFKSEAEKDFNNLTIAKKNDFWQKELSKCSRCYACRNICPMCYCQDQCIIDGKSPKWVGESINNENNLMFHMIRAMHMVGRCVECGECSRACPQGIPLTFIYKKMNEEMQELYNYLPGLDSKEKPLLGSYKEDDPEAV